MMICDSTGGTCGLTTTGGTGVRARWAWTSCRGWPLPDGGEPVASSYRTVPREYRSARWSTGRAVRPVSSGARYGSAPSILVWWMNSGSISATSVAREKSTRTGDPSPEITTLAGQMARWVTPRACTSARTAARSRASRSSGAGAMGTGRSARRVPATSRSSSTSGPGGGRRWRAGSGSGREASEATDRAAVNGDAQAGQVARRRGEHERGDAAELFRVADAPQRDLPLDGCAGGFGVAGGGQQLPDPVGVDPVGQQADHADAPRAVLVGHVLGDAGQPRPETVGDAQTRDRVAGRR